jgi:cytochrome b561
MSAVAQPGHQGRSEAIFGWILAISFLVLTYNIISLPRTALNERDTLRVFHDSFGLIFVLLVGVRLVWMMRKPAPRPPPGLPASSFGFNRALLVAFYVSFVATGFIGLIYGWGEFDREVVFFGLTIASPFGDSDTVRKFFGYFHSALSFYYLALIGVWLLFGLYQHFRYRVGLRRMLPGVAV